MKNKYGIIISVGAVIAMTLLTMNVSLYAQSANETFQLMTEESNSQFLNATMRDVTDAHINLAIAALENHDYHSLKNQLKLALTQTENLLDASPQVQPTTANDVVGPSNETNVLDTLLRNNLTTSNYDFKTDTNGSIIDKVLDCGVLLKNYTWTCEQLE